MNTQKLALTVLTMASIAAAPPAASAAAAGPDKANCSPFYCGGSGNHNEILVNTAGR